MSQIYPIPSCSCSSASCVTSSSGSGGSSGGTTTTTGCCWDSGADDPVAPPSDLTTQWFYINETTSTVWRWDTTLASWVQLDFQSAIGFIIRPTVVSLRQVDDNGMLLFAATLGNLVPGDSQSRFYRWNATEAGADDGISIIRPNSKAPGELGAWNEL